RRDTLQSARLAMPPHETAGHRQLLRCYLPKLGLALRSGKILWGRTMSGIPVRVLITRHFSDSTRTAQYNLGTADALRGACFSARPTIPTQNPKPNNPLRLYSELYPLPR